MSTTLIWTCFWKKIHACRWFLKIRHACHFFSRVPTACQEISIKGNLFRCSKVVGKCSPGVPTWICEKKSTRAIAQFGPSTRAATFSNKRIYSLSFIIKSSGTRAAAKLSMGTRGFFFINPCSHPGWAFTNQFGAPKQISLNANFLARCWHAWKKVARVPDFQKSMARVDFFSETCSYQCGEHVWSILWRNNFFFKMFIFKNCFFWPKMPFLLIFHPF